MELRRYTNLFARWWWVILLSTFLAAGSAYIFSKNSTSVYEATSLMLVSQSKAGAIEYNALLNSERLAGTYAELLRRQPVLDEVIQRLSLATTLELLGKTVSVAPIRNTQLLQLKVRDTDPVRAAAIANEIPRVFIQQNEELQSARFAAARSGLKQRSAEIQEQIALLQGKIAELRQATPLDQTELDRLQRDLNQLQVGYTDLFNTEQKLSLDQANQLDTLAITEVARPPLEPILPRTLQNTLLAAMVGVMLALGGIFLLEYLDDVLKNPDDVQSVLGLATLGAVPVMKEITPGSELAILGQNPLAKESYRVLRTNLQFASVDRPLLTILVTSASPSEGKTLTAANLSGVLAQAGRRVILVDADLHRPRQHRLFKLPNNVGLTNALLNEGVALEALLQETPVPGLRLLTSGPVPPNPAELVGSARMRELLAQLTSLADTVVIDSPPTMAVSDTAILSSEVDGVLLVLDAGQTRREMAVRALTGLRQVQARVLGVVLNRMPSRGAGSYYYYYSHDGYGSTSGSNKKPATGLAGITARWSFWRRDEPRPGVSVEAPKTTK